MKKKSNNKKPLVALVLLLLVGVVGGTFAYFSSSAGFENLFKTSPYNVTYEEEFVSPTDWTPGTTTDKTVSVTNNTAQTEHEGINIAVRFKVEEEWSDGVSATLENGEKAAVLNFADDFGTKFELKDGYYYYLTELKPGETVNFLESVTFNKLATDGDDGATCIREDVTDEDGNKTGEKVVCTGASYADAEYTLNITAETVQADAYAEYWNTDVVIAAA